MWVVTYRDTGCRNSYIICVPVVLQVVDTVLYYVYLS